MSRQEEMLTEAHVIQIMREEWDRRVQKLVEIDAEWTQADGTKKDAIPDQLLVRHKDSGLMYTVIEDDENCGPNVKVLEAPSGEKLVVNLDAFEKEYERD